METKTMMDMALTRSVEHMEVGLGSSDKGNVESTLKPRKKTMISLYLKFFETAPDGKSRRCKFCKQSYSIATATGDTASAEASQLQRSIKRGASRIP